jgi:hypothetical protein
LKDVAVLFVEVGPGEYALFLDKVDGNPVPSSWQRDTMPIYPAPKGLTSPARLYKVVDGLRDLEPFSEEYHLEPGTHSLEAYIYYVVAWSSLHDALVEDRVFAASAVEPGLRVLRQADDYSFAPPMCIAATLQQGHVYKLTSKFSGTWQDRVFSPRWQGSWSPIVEDLGTVEDVASRGRNGPLGDIAAGDGGSGKRRWEHYVPPAHWREAGMESLGELEPNQSPPYGWRTPPAPGPAPPPPAESNVLPVGSCFYEK